MKITSKGWRLLLAATIATVAVRASAADTLEPFENVSDVTSDLFGLSDIACDWRVANGTPTATSNPDAMRWGYIDLAAGYWQMILSPRYPAGTHFRIEGQYPKARNFSFQLYDGPNLGLGSLTDYQIVPDAGSQSPYRTINFVDRSVAPGGRYTIDILYGPRPATPAANTLYVDASEFKATSLAVFSYRIYNAYPGVGVAAHGGVPMPAVHKVTADGDVPLAELDNRLVCAAGLAQRDTRRRLRAAALDVLHGTPKRPGPISPYPLPAPPEFVLRDDPADILLNADVRYIYARLDQRDGDLVLIRGRAPSYATGPGAGSDPQLRHWSICENALLSVETYACVEDEDATIDASGFYNVVISVPTKRPPNATPAHGFDWLPYGTVDVGVPIYRHMLASPNFTQSAFRVPVGSPQLAPSVMGDYFPVATYCANSVFAAHTARGETPAQVFAGCRVGY